MVELCYAQRIIGILANLHWLMFVHRDMKPLNLFLDGDGQVKFIELGSATAHQAQATMTTGAGMPAFTEPAIKALPRTCFLAVTIWVLISGGAEPFPGTMLVQIDIAVCTQGARPAVLGRLRAFVREARQLARSRDLQRSLRS